MAYFSGIGVHKDGFQVAHEQRVDVQLLAQAVHGNEVEMEIEFGEIEDFHRQCAARPVRGSQSVGFLPDSPLDDFPAREGSRKAAPQKRSADFQSAVSQGFQPAGLAKRGARRAVRSSAD